LSALWKAEAACGAAGPTLVPMTTAAIDAVMAIEAAVYPFPWTRGNFIDSLASGYIAELLHADADRRLLGYFVAMVGADEMHLLNITVAPPLQRQGHGRLMVQRLVAHCRGVGARRLWLEVRVGNAGARAAYHRLGFAEMGVRPGYYPAAHGMRESAVVMSLPIGPRTGDVDALE
jgi:ribosomal-protein-alanine N-acetyltransferase